MGERSERKIATKRLKELVTKGYTNTPDGRLLAPGYVTKLCISQEALNDESMKIIKGSRIIYMNDEEKFQVMELLKGLGMNPTDRKFVKL
jgi:hypothetical protein